MGIRLSVGIATLLITILANDMRVATAAEPSRLAALNARQQLRDEVCIAMASGHMSRADRYTILTDAKAILKPAEYEGFKRALDRLSPPPVTVIRTTTLAAKKASPPVDRPAPLQAGSPPKAAPEVRLTVPADVSWPDRVAAQTASPVEQAAPVQVSSPFRAAPEARLTVPADVSWPDRVAWAVEMR
jgi:hypothetical protein